MLFKLKSLITDSIYFLVKLNLIKLSGRFWTTLHLKKVLEGTKFPEISINKIAFLVHDDISFDHIQNVIKNLPQGTFDIILVNYKGIFCFSHVLDIILNRTYTKIQTDKIKNIIKKSYPFCRLRTIHEVIESRERYCWLVCGHNGLNHTARCIIKDNLVYGANLLADHLAYFQFAIDPDQASNVKNCQVFDKIFCVGAWQAKLFRGMPIKAKVFDYGSPRFDSKIQSHDNLDVKALLDNDNHFDCSKRTILWLPTHTKATTVVDFLPNMQNLTQEYNVLLKAHTDCFSEMKGLENVIRKNAPDVTLVKDKDSADLMGIADFVCCDYGGSVFTAIGMDKNVILLNSKHDSFARRHFCTDCKNGKIKLRDNIVNFYYNEQEKILNALRDSSVWERQSLIRKNLREQYLSVHKEPSGKLIADELLSGLE